MTTYLLDYNRGSDSNDGISAPWQNLTKLDDAAYTAGDQFLLASDSVWEYDIATRVVPPNTWTGTRDNPVVIGSYAPLSASTGKPTIRWNRRIAANEWTWNAQNNGWLYTAPFNVGFLCLVRLAGTWESSRIDDFVENSVPLESIDGRYNAVATRFYLWAPESTNPTDYYGEVLLSLTSTGFFSISTARNFVKFQGLRFEETGCGILIYSGGAGSTGVAVRDLEAQTCSAIVYANTDGALGSVYADIQGIQATDWGPAVVHGNATNGGGFVQFDVSGCDIRDGMHSHSQGAIYCQVRTAGMTPRIFDNYFEGVRWGTRDKEADGSAVYCETGCDGVQVFRNVVRNAYCAFQDGSGRANTFHHNLIVDCWSAMQVGDPKNNNATNHTFVHNTCLVGNSALTPTYGDGRTSTGWRCFDNAGGAMVFDVRNNLFFDRAGNTTRAAVIVPQTAWSGPIDSNAVYGYSTVAEKEFSGGAGAAPSPTNTVLTDPLVTGGGRPMPGSPLLGAGAALGYGRDIERKQRPTAPAIGAYDVATLRQVA